MMTYEQIIIILFCAFFAELVLKYPMKNASGLAGVLYSQRYETNQMICLLNLLLNTYERNI